MVESIIPAKHIILEKHWEKRYSPTFYIIFLNPLLGEQNVWEIQWQPAAICLGLYLIGCIFYVFQLLFMTETWLAGEKIGPEAIPVARVLGSAFLGFIVGLILTYLNGPDGQKIYFYALLVAQICTLLNLWHQHLFTVNPTVFDDAMVVSVLTALLLIGFFRIKSRL